MEDEEDEYIQKWLPTYMQKEQKIQKNNSTCVNSLCIESSTTSKKDYEIINKYVS